MKRPGSFAEFTYFTPFYAVFWVNKLIQKIERNPSNSDMPDSKLAYTNPCRTYAKEQKYCQGSSNFYFVGIILPCLDNFTEFPQASQEQTIVNIEF